MGAAQQVDEIPRSLQELVRPHIDSFDYFLGDGLLALVEQLKPVEVRREPAPRTSLPCALLTGVHTTEQLTMLFTHHLGAPAAAAAAPVHA